MKASAASSRAVRSRHPRGPRVGVPGVLRRLRGQCQGDLDLGEVDDVDVEAAVLAGLLGDPRGHHRAEPSVADAADDDHQVCCSRSCLITRARRSPQRDRGVAGPRRATLSLERARRPRTMLDVGYSTGGLHPRQPRRDAPEPVGCPPGSAGGRPGCAARAGRPGGHQRRVPHPDRAGPRPQPVGRGRQCHAPTPRGSTPASASTCAT